MELIEVFEFTSNSDAITNMGDFLRFSKGRRISTMFLDSQLEEVKTTIISSHNFFKELIDTWNLMFPEEPTKITPDKCRLSDVLPDTCSYEVKKIKKLDTGLELILKLIMIYSIYSRDALQILNKSINHETKV